MIHHSRFQSFPGPKAWVHKVCLAALGLHPFPDDSVPLAETIGATVVRRIAEVADEYPLVRAPKALADAVYRRLSGEYTIPTADGRRQLRWMIGRKPLLLWCVNGGH